MATLALVQRECGKGRGLIVEIRFTEQHRAAATQKHTLMGVFQCVFVWNCADHDGGNVGARSSQAAGLVCSVNALYELLREGQVLADQNVEVFVSLCHALTLRRGCRPVNRAGSSNARHRCTSAASNGC